MLLKYILLNFNLINILKIFVNFFNYILSNIKYFKNINKRFTIF